MPHATARPAAAEAEPSPPDIATMRATVRRLLAADAELPTPDELSTLAPLLRGHINALVPTVENAASRLPKDDVPRACAMACVGEARMRLRLGDGDTETVRAAVAVRLARSVNALTDHYETLSP
ncbi:hypothetical protein CP966_25300 [Streptomyces galilaeus]|uniref:DUF6415 family natural product biosynthesis protein n=1 Tax=Streptomyces galilaeus TaxID=33899 RepID=UPI00123DE3FF|nr:DUF6415 family natural product biosynthesis protein [Streptomyces galilaeus]QEU68193.1 hypothetical protein CP966_25300 [Streptomyces galilaeus]GGW47308.1 hypothetical protein GCM10010350_34270 [Streptomyces galilaeus]